MANPEHVEIVRQGAAAIARWREAHPEERIDLTEAVLGEPKQWYVSASGGLDLAGADLHRADLGRINLNAANLKGANLRRALIDQASLIRANLQGADLQGCVLTETNLRNVQLLNAKLNFADLKGSSLYRARLSRAQLRGADLRGTDLSWAHLNGADLTGAVLHGTVFVGVSLPASRVRGLHEVDHRGSSVLGRDTFALSHGEIPDPFLRGCGLPDWEIEAAKLHRPDLSENERTDILYRVARLLRGQSIQFYSVFISYSHGDRVFARKLHDALQDQGVRCWLDEREIKVGARIRAAVDEGIRLSDKVIVCCSDSSLNESTWVEDEIERALEKERVARKKRQKHLALIPLDLDGSVWKWDHDLKTTLLNRKVGDFQGWQDDDAKFDATLEKLVQALRSEEFKLDPGAGQGAVGGLPITSERLS